MSLRDPLRSPDAQRRAAACAQAASDPSAVVWVDALADALADDVRSVRDAASTALAVIGRDHDVTAALKRTLHGNDARGRWAAAWTLARLAPPEPALIPAAVEALDADEGSVRWRAAQLLVELGRLHAEVPTLLCGLARQGASPGVKRMALFCLRDLAPGERHTWEVLLEATHEPDPVLRRAAFTALAGMLDPPPATLARLARAVDDERDPVCRALASRALGALTHQVTPASPA